MPNRRAAELTECAYKCLVGLAGWAALVLLNVANPGAASVLEITFFILLSAASKRLGIQVVQGGTLSLVGVIDLAALFIFGAPTAAIVAVTSNVLFHLSNINSLHAPVFSRTLLLAFFNSGLNGLMVLATAAIYRLLGGAIPLQQVSWAALLPVLAACLCWFLLDHLGWALAQLPASGFAGAYHFISAIIHYSLLLELMPLPLAVLVAFAYLNLSTPLVILLTLLFIAIGIIIRRLVSTLRLEQERAAQLTAIAQVSRKVAAILDLNTLFVDSVKLIQGTFDYYCVNLFIADEATHEVRFQASSSPLIQQRGIDIGWGQGIIGHTAASGVSVLANDVRQDDRFLPDSGLEETHAELAIPMKVEQRILGVLDLQSDRVNAFSQQDANVLQTLADQIAIAIEDSRLYEAQQEQTWVSTALLQVADAVADLTTAEEILESVARLTVMLSGVHCCLVLLWSEEEQVFTAIESAGLNPQQAQTLKNQRFSKDAVPLLAQVREEGRPVRGRVEDLTRYLPPPTAQLDHCDEMLALPLRAQGIINGVLLVSEPTGEPRLAVHRQSILAGIANHTAMALNNARLYAAQLDETWISTALLQVANTISSNRNLEDILATVVRLTPFLAGIDWSAILLWDDEKRALFVARTYGLPHKVREAFEGHYLPIAQLQLDIASFKMNQPIALDLSQIENMPALTGTPTAWALRSPDRFLGALVVGTDLENTLNRRRTSIVAGIANQTSIAIESYQLYQQTLDQQRLQRSLELAHDIQQGFLPECCPQIAGWDIASEWRAARDVGGDYYDFIQLDATHTGLVIGDVSDKGIAAALYMALSRAVVRAAALGMLGPAETLTRANRILMEDSRSGMFISLFYAILDTRNGQMKYARAGHNPPLVVRASDNSLQALDSAGMVLGIEADPHIVQATVELAPGDLLLMYTDGVTEAINELDEEFGEERLRQIVTQTGELNARAIVERINSAVRIFCGEREQFDDFTVVVVKRNIE